MLKYEYPKIVWRYSTEQSSVGLQFYIFTEATINSNMTFRNKENLQSVSAFMWFSKLYVVISDFNIKNSWATCEQTKYNLWISSHECWNDGLKHHLVDVRSTAPTQTPIKAILLKHFWNRSWYIKRIQPPSPSHSLLWSPQVFKDLWDLMSQVSSSFVVKKQI